MKKSFLDGLIGLNVKDASVQCTAAGYRVEEHPPGVFRSMEVKPGVVLLWLGQDNITVRNATCDDPMED